MTNNIVFHCATYKDLERYRASNCILPPVRFWFHEDYARKWAVRTGHDLVISFPKPDGSQLIHDHKGAGWYPGVVYTEKFIHVDKVINPPPHRAGEGRGR